MINLIIGIVLGAMFSPFWMMLFNQAKARWAARQK